ncbi:TRAP transporter large permease subunit [Candidatus Bipolaricaulota bacterium]|nr:TRAP transporter large permease subunit [Candidatus Bipolaricaulota bacterium]
MSPELITFLSMVLVFIVSAMIIKLPVSLSLVAASVVGSLVGVASFPVRHLVEGTFGYLDTILVIATAMIYMKGIQMSGLLSTMAHQIIKGFHKRPLVLLIVLTFFAMFPGMITGSSTVAVLTAGAIVAPVLLNLGIPRNITGAIIAIAGILGMIAPPVNIPAMIIGGGVDMPYIGFSLPLILATFPLAVLFSLGLGYRYLGKVDLGEMDLPQSYYSDFGWSLYVPFIVLIALLVVEQAFTKVVPSLGMPLIFLIGATSALVFGKKVKVLETTKKAIEEALPIMGILAGVGMFIQIMTLTGVRGFVVSVLTGLPQGFLYLSIGVSMPLFGAVSAYGSASILGVPFMLSLLGTDQILAASALSLTAGLGDLMPPTALAGLFAAQVVDQENYFKIVKYCVLPGLVTIGYGIFLIISPW